MRKPAAGLWWWVALAGVLLLPWHMQQEGVGPASLLALFQDDPEAASAAAQAVRHGRFWFWPVLAALLVAAPAVLRPGMVRERRGLLLALGGLAGLAAIVAQGFAIGIRGWNAPWLEALFGPIEDRQFGIGLGGAVAAVGFLFQATDGLALRGAFKGDRFTAGAVGLLVGSILVFTFWPMATILVQAFGGRGELGPLAAFADRLADRKVWGLACIASAQSCGVAWNTLTLAVSTATAATALGLAFALIATRTSFPARHAMRLLTVLPIITPPFVIGLGLILIFGRSGVLNQVVEALTGAQLGRWIYGAQGVWLAQVFSFTPTAFLVLIGVVEGISPTMEEASRTLRASPMRTFTTVSLPLMRPGLANAWLVVFVESLADFGNPIVLGGSFGVLSTEIFFAVVGAQADFGRAAMLALVLLAFALAAFFLQRAVLGRRSYVSMSGKGDGGLPSTLPRPVSIAAFAIAVPWAILTVIVYVMALAGAFVKVWGRDWTPTLDHFERAFSITAAPGGGFILSGLAWNSLGTTVLLAAIAAPITAALGLLASWVLSRQRFAGRFALEFALMLTFAVPGTVIGVAYILTYNIPPLEITGTGIILVACFVFRNMPVGVRSGMAAMSQLDRSLDEASATLRATTFRTLCRVVLPLLKPAVLTALVYSFVRAMTTVSAVIFLVSAQHEMATVFIINRVINGDYGVSIAYSAALILLMVCAIGIIQLLVGNRRLGRRRAAAPAVIPVGGRA
ncbi:iron(III) transport system permease protein [Stella humosa]|uniref:Iron(III) transport system permease protein n=1 Tax=Stella humosa TaxID=94 RepID=A0A3N1L3L1_9PROT|nr:iron ABC transporter permease [Stella humosa]ROP83995.1 iron(III) transport system permease protein [Stella humosa]BBK33504.1 iron ABC transporter permease [Stella humosa]